MKNETTRYGGVTQYWRNGKLVTRKRHNDVGNPSRSVMQEVGRRRWKNVQNLWTAFTNAGWKPRYQLKKPGQTDYNCFTSLAIQGTCIYLSEVEAKNYASVLLPLTISNGTLPTVNVEFDGVGVRSDIRVGDLIVGSDTPVCDLTRAIICNNHGFIKGDTITFVAGRQEVWPPYNHPHVHFRHCELPLDWHDGRPLSMLPGSDEAFCVRDGYIASSVNEGACTWVHERKPTSDGAPAMYSTQTMWCSNDETIARYSGQAALDAAIASYKNLKKRAMLDPNPLAEDMAGKI